MTTTTEDQTAGQTDGQTEGQKEPMFPDLRRMADEIRVRIHLAGLDAKDAWAQMETRLHALEGKAQQLGARAKDQLVEIGSLLEREMKELVGRLPGREPKDDASRTDTDPAAH